MKLAPREKVLVFATSLAVIFLFYWYVLLNPLFSSAGKTNAEAAGLRKQLVKLRAKPALSQVIEKEIKIYPREEQLNYIINFIDKKFKWFGIEMLSLQQSAEENKLSIDLQFESTYYQMLGFLNSLPELGTLLVIDNVNISQKGSRIITDMKILSGYL